MGDRLQVLGDLHNNEFSVQNLASSLRGLTVDDTVNASQLAAVIGADNGIINFISTEQLIIHPVEDLLAIQTVLYILLNTAYANN
jgi:hypothetical protein